MEDGEIPALIPLSTSGTEALDRFTARELILLITHTLARISALVFLTSPLQLGDFPLSHRVSPLCSGWQDAGWCDLFHWWLPWCLGRLEMLFKNKLQPPSDKTWFCLSLP